MIAPGDVRPGKCFLSTGPKPQVMRVRSVKAGTVDFERLPETTKPGRVSQGQAPLDEFLAGLEREVGCDFQPGVIGAYEVSAASAHAARGGVARRVSFLRS